MNISEEAFHATRALIEESKKEIQKLNEKVDKLEEQLIIHHDILHRTQEKK